MNRLKRRTINRGVALIAAFAAAPALLGNKGARAQAVKSEGVLPMLDESQIIVSGDLDFQAPGSFIILSPCESLQDIRTIIAGQSHAAAITRSLVTPRGSGSEMRTIELAKSLGIGGLRGVATPEYWDIVTNLGYTRNLAIVWNGNQYNADFLLSYDGLFDLVPRGYPETSVIPGAKIVAEAVIREHFRPTLEGLKDTLARLTGHGHLKRLVVGTPPPLFDSSLIRKRLLTEPGLTVRADKLGLDVNAIEITPASVRRKLWFVLQAMMAETAAEQHWQYVPIAPEALDPRGFLDPTLSGGDITHANLAYGAMMVDQISRYLRD